VKLLDFWQKITEHDEELLDQLRKQLKGEPSYQHVISSMCTPPNPLSRVIAGEFAEINLGDPGLFPRAVELEKEVLKEIAKLTNAPKGWEGTITSGGSESNILGCWAARNWGRKTKNLRLGKILYPVSAHVSFQKAFDLLAIPTMPISLNENYQIDIEALKEKIDDKTVGIIGIAGSTGTGACDNIKALSEIALDHQLFLHVDAAFGGLIFPFLDKLKRSSPRFDFDYPGVSSISIDAHKILGGLIPSGSIIFRSSEMTATIEKDITYLSDAKTKQVTITGTRPGAPVLAAWVLIKLLGWEYHTDRLKKCLVSTESLINELKKIDWVTLPFEPTINIVGFQSPLIAVDSIIKQLKIKGWLLSKYDKWARMVIMPHYNQKMIDNFIADLKQLSKELK
jgi:tyrosine decarboxylase/aspartate 1-decarboxylase